jgi:hypothetical protein
MPVGNGGATLNVEGGSPELPMVGNDGDIAASLERTAAALEYA